MRITTRLRLISAGTAGALLLLAGILYGSIAEFRAAKNTNALALKLKLNQFERTSCTDEYFLYREDRAQASWFQAKASADLLLRQGQAQLSGAEDLKRLERIRVNLEEASAIFQRIVGNSALLAGTGERRRVYGELDRRLASQLLVKTSVGRDLATAWQDASEGQVERAYQRLVFIVSGFATALGMMTVLTSIQISRLIRRRLVPLHAGVTMVAGGALEFRLAADARDEFGELAQSINAMTAKLQAITRQQEIQRSERKLSEVLEEVDAHVFLKDREGRYLFANRLLRLTLNVEREEIVGQTDEAFFDPGTLEQLRANDRLVLEEGRTLRTEETLCGLKGGTPTAYWSVRQPLRDESGAIYGLCGVATDLTERKQLEASLNQAQKLQSLGSLASGVAHDMNNVLGAILGLATAHLGIQPQGSAAHQAFETIATAALRGGDMVKGLLSFARQTPAENLPLDLNELLAGQARLLEHTTLSRIRLVLDLAEGLHPIRGDAGALSHAFLNLCVNAVDAMEEGGLLTLRTRNLGDSQVEVVVEDTGGGMAKEVLDKALDPYFTTKAQGKGTGLGLSMVHSTLMAHRGQMHLQSQAGQGTQVVLQFPACTGNTRNLEPEPEGTAGASCASLKVFLVDDDELVQRSIAMLLGLMGHQPSLASSGEEALAMLAGGFQPDVVILDLNMPGLGGAGTLAQLRGTHPGLPVLLATGRADQTALDLVAAHPQVTLMAKPFSMAELQQHLDPLRPG